MSLSAAAAIYAWLASVTGATALLWNGRRAAGIETDVASIAFWQALVYGLWAPVWIGLLFLLRRSGLGARGLAAAALFALPATGFHALAAAALDVRWSPRMERLGFPVALAERLPVDLLFYMAIAGATWAAVAHRQSRRLVEALAAARAATPEAAGEQPLLVTLGSRRVPVPLPAIEWLGAAGNYVVVNWDGREGLVRATLQELERSLDPALFARIHRSTLANLAMVESAVSLSDGSWRLTMKSGAELVASRTYRDRILARLGRR